MSIENNEIMMERNTAQEQPSYQFLLVSPSQQSKTSGTFPLGQLPECFVKQLKIFHSMKCKKDFSVDSGIKDLDRDQFGIIKSVKCASCDDQIPTVCHSDSPYYRVRIEKLSDLHCGDHIVWHRRWGYWHHAIFMEGLPPNSDSQECCSCWLTHDRVKVIAFNYSSKDKTIRVEESDVYLEGIDVYRYEYNECYHPDYTIELAKGTAKLFDETETSALAKGRCLQYDPLTDNCEHFARRCKTGHSESYQVQDCRKACGKNFLMSLWRLVILAIWMVCDTLVNEREAKTEEEREKRHTLELYLSVTLSCLFAFLYCLYALCRNVSKIRKSNEERGNSSEPTDRQTIAKTCICSNICCDRVLYGTCLRCCGLGRYILIWFCCCRFLCCLCYECPTGCQGSTKSYFLTNGSCNFRAFRDWSKIYCNVAIRVVIRELVATGIPIVILFFYEHSWHSLLFKDNNDSTKSALMGFAISVAVAQITLPIGVLLGSLVENVFLILCTCACCKARANSNGTNLQQESEENPRLNSTDRDQLLMDFV